MKSPSGATPPYDGWTREALIARLTELEGPRFQSKSQRPGHKTSSKPFNFTIHARRKIALKFCYSGWEYGGLAYQNSKTILPTVEGVLFDALAKARLIDPEGEFAGCEWEKCGRTDRGVSAAGQVISLWVRSALDVGIDKKCLSAVTEKSEPSLSTTFENAEDVNLNMAIPPASQLNDNTSTSLDFEFALDLNDFDTSDRDNRLSTEMPSLHTNTKFEHDYVSIINRLLPATIRIIAWSPVSPTFSARFSCTYRHYKYFFSSPTAAGVWLDIDRMRAAASRLVGEHDFRNLCKLDPAKQITLFTRRVIRAEIEPLSIQGDDTRIYVFNLIGTAFLYHQVRHIMAVLFLVGSGLEDPSVVSSLMNVEFGLDGIKPPLEVVDRKPEYQMADALPLMLWECGYPEAVLKWRTTGAESEDTPAGDDLYQQLHSIGSRSQIYTILNDHFLAAISSHHPPPIPYTINQAQGSPQPTALPPTLSIPLGGGTYKRTGQEKYVPLLRRPRLDSVEIVNERWRVGKGFRREERRRTNGDSRIGDMEIMLNRHERTGQ